MKTLNSKLGVFVLLLLTFVMGAFSSNAMAQSTIDTLQVQGYMQQSNGTAVTNSGSTTCNIAAPAAGYGLAFAVMQNGTAIWGTKKCVTVANGLFAQTLSGAGADLTALAAGTVGTMSANWTAVTLNAALLATGSGELSVEVFAIDAINSLHPLWTISMNAVPTAMLAQEALSVINHSITFGSMATSGVYANAGGAAADNLLIQATSAGVIDPSFLPGGGTIPTSNGGTGATSLTQNGVLFGNNTSPMGATAAGTNNTVLHGNTGAAPSFSAVGLTSDVTGTLGVANGGTGLATHAIGDLEFATAATTLSSLAIGGSGKLLSSTGTAPQWSTVASLNLAASGANSDITSANSMTSASTLAAVGTITTGVWTGTTIAAANGGTGLTTYTTGAIPVATGATTLSALPIGSTGQILTVSGGAPVWAANAATSAPTRSNLYMWEDFMSTTTAAITAATTYMTGTALLWSTGATVGNVNAAVNTPFHLGVLNINSGTAAAKNVGVGFCAGTYTAGTVVANDNFATTDNWTFTASLAISNVANTGSTWIGLLSTFPTTLVTNNANAGTFFEILNATVATTANVNAWSKGANANAAGGNVGAFTTGTFQNYTITYTGSSTTLNMFINGTLMATTANGTAIPTATNLCPSIQRASDTVGSQMQVDYIGFTQQTTVANGDR